MKHLKHLFTAILLLCTTFATAHEFEIDGIFYNIYSETNKTVEVTYKGGSYSVYSHEYYGTIVIPKTISYNGTIYSVVRIGSDAFRGCSDLTSIEIPNSVTSIGGSAFYDCSGLTSVTIPNRVTSIGNYAFSNCSGLTSVTIGNSVTSIGDYAFSNCSVLESITIPNSVTSIGNYAFADCDGLTSVTIGDGVKNIGEKAFYDCDGFTSVTIPNSVTSIGYRAFQYCDNLGTVINYSSLSFSKGSYDYGYIAYYADEVVNAPNGSEINGLYFSTVNGKHTLVKYLSDVTEVVLPDNYKGENYEIANEAFVNCNWLTSIEIPNSVTSIRSNAFSGCTGLTSVYINDLSVWCNIEFDNELANPLYYAKYLYSNGELLTNIVLPEGVAVIKKYAFTNYFGLKSIKIPNSVTSIGESAFDWCSGLTSVTIGNGVTSIGKSAFEDCSGLTSVIIPNSVTSIGDYAFEECTGLKSVTIPNSVTSIGDYAFQYCNNLGTVINYSSLRFSKGSSNYGHIAYYADEVVNAPNGSVINDMYFSTVSGKHTLVRYLGKETELVLPDNYRGENYKIANNAFYACRGLITVEIPNGVTLIGDYVFCHCSGLTSVKIPNSVTGIGDYTFLNCYDLASITVEHEVPINIGASVFDDYSATLYVPYGTKSAYQAADVWKNFTNIVEIEQVEPVTEVTINVDESGYATYCSEYALDFSEIDDVKVYAATGYKSDTQVVTLARVMTTAAETGIFIKGEPGEYVVPVIDECSEHSLNLFVGTFVETTVNSTSGGKYNFNFKVNNDDSAPMFYPFEDSTIFGANKAYLQIPSEWLDTNASKSISIMFDDEEANGLKGDINGDGRVSVTDIQSVVNIILNVE